MQHISWFLKLCLPGTIILATSLSPSHGGPPMAPMAPPTGKIQIVKTSDLAMSAIFADKCECENLLKKVLHATILHLVGLDHLRLSYTHNGLEEKLTMNQGEVIRKVLA